MTTHPEAAPARANDTEPVAWRYRDAHPTEAELLRSHPWHFAFNDVRNLAEDLGVELGAVEPLYTSDALATARAEGRAEGMREAAGIARRTAADLSRACEADGSCGADEAAEDILAAIPQEIKP